MALSPGHRLMVVLVNTYMMDAVAFNKTISEQRSLNNSGHLMLVYLYINITREPEIIRELPSANGSLK